MVVLGRACFTLGGVRAITIADQLIGDDSVRLDDLLNDAFASLVVIATAARIVAVLRAATGIRIGVCVVVIARSWFVVSCVGSALIWILRICWLMRLLIFTRLIIWMAVIIFAGTNEVEDLKAIHFAHQLFVETARLPFWAFACAEHFLFAAAFSTSRCVENDVAM